MTSDQTSRPQGDLGGYAVSVETRGEQFYLTIDELRLVVVAPTVEAGYAEISARKRELFERYEDLGRRDALPLPRQEAARQEMRHALTPFLIKAAVVAIIGAVLIGAANMSIVYTLQTAPKKLASYGARTAVKNFQRAFEKAAAKEMSPERVEKIKTAIRDAVPALQPFADELRPLLSCPPAARGDGAG